jgi:dTDP-4-amino-4,6-dideoxygalactose transaminase
MSITAGFQIPFTGLQRQYNDLREEILHTTDQVLASGQLMNGSHTQAFESWLANKNGQAHAVTCHSGTNALEILAAYWIQFESINPPTVVLPAVSYVATANAFIRAGWDVYFADVDGYGIIDPDTIPHNLSYQAIVLVGLYGNAMTHHVRVRHWQKWINEDIIVIEDAAQHWLAADCKRIGHGAAVSFDPMKNLAAYGNGGAVITDIDDIANFARDFRDNGKHTGHRGTGSNCRMSELDCATMMIKAAHIDSWQARRQDIALQYIEGFANANLRCLIDDTNFYNHAFHKFVIEVDNRDEVKARLAGLSIETKVHYEHALPEHSAYRQYPAPDMMGACYSLTRRALSLPIYPELTDSEVEYIIKSVLDCVS